MRGCGMWPIYHGYGLFLSTTQHRVPGYSPYRWYIGHIPQTPEVPYCYYKLVTNVIRIVKSICLSYPWYTVWYTTAKGCIQALRDASCVRTSLTSCTFIGHTQWLERWTSNLKVARSNPRQGKHLSFCPRTLFLGHRWKYEFVLNWLALLNKYTSGLIGSFHVTWQ